MEFSPRLPCLSGDPRHDEEGGRACPWFFPPFVMDLVFDVLGLSHLEALHAIPEQILHRGLGHCRRDSRPIPGTAPRACPGSGPAYPAHAYSRPTSADEHAVSLVCLFRASIVASKVPLPALPSHPRERRAGRLHIHNQAKTIITCKREQQLTSHY